MSRESAYDEEIMPLMAKILDVCKREGIPVVASFQINEPTDGDERFCQSFRLTPDSSDVLRAMVEIIMEYGGGADAARSVS